MISAVGHEVDITIADLVADARAPTPSAAAERAVPDRAALQRDLVSARVRMEAVMCRRLNQSRARLDAYDRELIALLHDQVRTRQNRLAHLSARLESLSPLAALRRGYAVALDQRGRVIRTAGSVAPGDEIQLRVADGSIGCRVENVEPSGG